MTKRILLSLGMIVFVGAVVVGATGAFFSDTETSTGNTFTAGAIDLQIDNESYYNGEINPGTTWLDPRDLDDGQGPGPDGAYLFFNFDDLKPGDEGEDTISIHVGTNEAYACMALDLTATNENGITEPEDGDGDQSENEGELQDAINFVWWVDDGDNVLEEGEDMFGQNSLANLNGLQVAISDSSENSLVEGPLDPEQTYYIAKAWCFGDLELDPVPGNGGQNPTVESGILCDGSNVNNVTQTDSVEATLAFTAVQSRNNENFVCGEEECVEEDETIFSDNFESYAEETLLDVANWDQEGGARVQDDGGNNVAELDAGDNDNSEVLTTVTINTTGYDNVELLYDRELTGTESGDTFTVEYSVDGGSNWTNLETTDGASVGSESKQFSLSPDADNIVDLKVRFMLTGTADNDRVLIDNVVVRGDTECDEN